MSLICRWVRGRLRSSTSSLLDVRPSRRATVADRSFPTAACPTIWNGHRENVASATSLLTFRRKNKSTYISTILPGHYFVTVSCRSGPCGFFTRAIITIAECNVIIVMTGCRRRNDVAQLQFLRHEHSHWNRQTCSE